MRRFNTIQFLASVALILCWAVSLSAQGPAPPPDPITLVSTDQFPSIQEAIDSGERNLYIPLGQHNVTESIVIEGWDGGVIVGGGLLDPGSVIRLTGAGAGIEIRNCRDLTLYNLQIEPRDLSEDDAGILISGASDNINLINLNVFRGPDFEQGVSSGTLVRVRAPANVMLEHVTLDKADVGLEVDHPGAEVTWLGGGPNTEEVNVRQLEGHVGLYGIGFGVQLPDSGVNIELNSPTTRPIVVAGTRMERTEYYLKTAATTDPIDVILKGSAIINSLLSNPRFIDYQAGGNLSLLAVASTLGGIEASSGTGIITSVGGTLGRVMGTSEPYDLNSGARALSIGEIMRWNIEEVPPAGEPFTVALTPERLQELDHPVPANVTFAGSGTLVPDMSSPFVEPVAVPLIANIADFARSVKEFGAIGDGVTDDTDAIQQAIDASRNTAKIEDGEYFSLYFPPGEYLVTRALDTGAGIAGWWVGAGMDATTIRAATGSVVRTNMLSMATFQEMTFETAIGDPDPVVDLDSDGVGDPLESVGNNAVFFARCRFVGGAGLAMGRTSNHSQSSENMAIDCEFVRCSTGFRVGNGNANDNVAVRCLFKACGIALAQIPAGGIQAFECQIDGSTDTDFYLEGVEDFYIQNLVSNSPSLIRTPNHAGNNMVVFEGYRYEGPAGNQLTEIYGGGSYVFLKSDIGDGFFAAEGAGGHISVFLVDTPSPRRDMFREFGGLARGFVLKSSASFASVSSGNLESALGADLTDGSAAAEVALNPVGLSVDVGGTVYVADLARNAILKVVGESGEVSRMAGNGAVGFSGDGGPARDASLNLLPTQTSAIDVDGDGNVYVADAGNFVVRKIDAATGVISTVAGNGSDAVSGAGGLAAEAGIGSPMAVVTGADGSLYIATSSRVWKVEGANGTINVVAGNGVYAHTGDGGPATTAALNGVRDIAFGANGDLYIADDVNRRARKVDGSTGIITTVAGFGYPGVLGDGVTATNASLYGVSGIAVDSAGIIYIADPGSHRVGWVDSEGILFAYAGNAERSFGGDDGPAKDASLDGPLAVASDSEGNIYVADAGNGRIRRIDGTTGIITTVAGVGAFSGDGNMAAGASINAPRDVFGDASGNLYIADSENHRLRRIDAETGIISTIAGSGSDEESGDAGAATEAGFAGLADVFIDTEGSIYIADDEAGSIRKVGAGGTVTTLVGSDDVGAPAGLFVDEAGDVYVADRENSALLKVEGDGTVTEVLGDSQLNRPTDLIVDGWGNLYIADSGNDRIRKVDGVTGGIETIAGGGGEGGMGSASLDRPEGIFLDGRGDLFIADTGNGRVLKVDAVTDEATVVVSGLSDPQAVFVDGEGTLFIAETGRNRIPKIADAGAPTVLPVKPMPIAVSLSRENGRIDGGTEVTLTGANFVEGVTVSVGGQPATGVTVVSGREIVFTTPVGSIGAVDVVVTNPDDQTATLVGGFTYEEASGPDFDGDGIVGFDDFLAFAGAFGSRLGDLDYEAKFDLTDDGRVDFEDFLEFAGSFGRRL